MYTLLNLNELSIIYIISEWVAKNWFRWNNTSINSSGRSFTYRNKLWIHLSFLIIIVFGGIVINFLFKLLFQRERPGDTRVLEVFDLFTGNEFVRLSKLTYDAHCDLFSIHYFSFHYCQKTFADHLFNHIGINSTYYFLQQDYNRSSLFHGYFGSCTCFRCLVSNVLYSFSVHNKNKTLKITSSLKQGESDFFKLQYNCSCPPK